MPGPGILSVRVGDPQGSSVTVYVAVEVPSGQAGVAPTRRRRFAAPSMSHLPFHLAFPVKALASTQLKAFRNPAAVYAR
ncbi:MAG TPA: hypothetical protein VFE93_04780 [Myxococcaceae bacterium]|nr:hypothetical protein [Myxococcaceae bacterium]